ncbi:hypothetical protein GCM10010404_90150 [Nonomuraea africana]|uniref:Uncharacterized protein n=1 Tax=Nonomuraea africana TaxID=46171 RepID=A0ABR9KDT8_9ACTN|nr:hypothetical protein [Nonomuraea africana]MBE1560125.1 hypothetical protein [Nonomuraea africana]
MTDDPLQQLLGQRAELDRQIAAERERRRNDHDERIARIDDALHAYAREHRLPLDGRSRKNAAIYTVDDIAVEWIDEFGDSDDLPRIPLSVHDLLGNVRVEFDAAPPAAAVIGLIDGFRSSRS